MPGAEPLRFVDILTTASAAANYEASPSVEARHMVSAVRILRGELSVEDLGRPISPLIASRMARGGVASLVQELVRRWYAALGDDPSAELDPQSVDRLLAELAEIEPDPGDRA